MGSSAGCQIYKAFHTIVTNKTGILQDKNGIHIGGYLVYDSSPSTEDEDIRKVSLTMRLRFHSLDM